MTLVLAMGCTDGIVIAADSMMADETNIKSPTEKINRIPGLPILYGQAGDVGLQQKMDEALASVAPGTTLKAIRRNIKRQTAAVFQESSETWVRYPRPPFHEPPEDVLLFAGILGRKPWIMQIETDNRDTAVGDEMAYFAAIGSGKPMAQALFRAHLRTERTLKLGKIFAYRIIDDAIDLMAFGLGPPISIYTMALDGTVQRVDDAEQRRLLDTCEVWRQLERDAVGQVLAGHGEEASPDIPEPE
jgi:ATP-dependent protease HslVU (ClpYQ) peptidase subunit